MRLHICKLREDGDYDVLCGFETETLGEWMADELVSHTLTTLQLSEEFEGDQLVVIPWDGDVDVIDGSDPDIINSIRS